MALRSDDDNVFDEDEIIEPLDLDEDEDEQPDAAIPDEVYTADALGTYLRESSRHVDRARAAAPRRRVGTAVAGDAGGRIRRHDDRRFRLGQQGRALHRRDANRRSYGA